MWLPLLIPSLALTIRHRDAMAFSDKRFVWFMWSGCCVIFAQTKQTRQKENIWRSLRKQKQRRPHFLHLISSQNSPAPDGRVPKSGTCKSSFSHSNNFKHSIAILGAFHGIPHVWTAPNCAEDRAWDAVLFLRVFLQAEEMERQHANALKAAQAGRTLSI